MAPVKPVEPPGFATRDRLRVRADRRTSITPAEIELRPDGSILAQLDPTHHVTFPTLADFLEAYQLAEDDLEVVNNDGWREHFVAVAVVAKPISESVSSRRGVVGWKCLVCGLILAGEPVTSCPTACPHCEKHRAG